MAPAAAGSELRLSVPRAEQLSHWDALAGLRQAGSLCDVALRGSDGEVLAAHAVVLGAVSKRLRRQLEAAAEGPARPLEVTVEAPGDAVRAVLHYVYEGSARVGPRAAPHVLRVAQRWELTSLQDALVSSLLESLSPEIATGLFALGEPFGERLGAAARAYILSNFVECAKSEPYGRWPAAVLDHILRSDDLVIECEEEVLACLAHWRQAGEGRDKASMAALSAVRWPLLSLPALDALAKDGGGAGAFCKAVAEQSLEARAAHLGPSSDSAIPALRPRRSYTGWWAGIGCAARGGTVLAGRGAAGKAGQAALRPRVIRPHEGTLLFLDATEEPGCVLQWFLRAHCGRSIAGKGSHLMGAGAEFEDIADVWSGPDDFLYILDRDAERVVQILRGESEVVGKGSFRLQRPCALAVDADHAVYVLEAGGSRVLRYMDGRATIAAGHTDPGTSPGELNAGPTGRIFVSGKGRLYVSDTENHRVQRWDPGATEGVTVAGGHGCGAGLHQLNHPGGIWALDDGTLFIADTGNHRIMKWKDGAEAGITAAGGCGPGDGLHQLREPLDVAVEAPAGSLLVADLGNARVVRWVVPAVPAELMDALGCQAKT
uniref:BTB domain-containing protein n=1 Tax=Pyrodinium bahamense TaxID=73915 RepID=A0A7S0AJ71_9DINO